MNVLQQYNCTVELTMAHSSLLFRQIAICTIDLKR